MQIHEVAAVWNTILFILSLLSSSSSKDQNIKNDLTDVTWKSSQLYLSEFEKKKKLMIMRAPSIDPLQAILLHDTSLRGEVGEFHATNKIKFFELVTPKQGVGERLSKFPLTSFISNCIVRNACTPSSKPSPQFALSCIALLQQFNQRSAEV
jgi:hypothetical protein